MTTLDWRDPDHRQDDVPAKNDPWFGVAMGLIGFIVGFFLFGFLH